MRNEEEPNPVTGKSKDIVSVLVPVYAGTLTAVADESMAGDQRTTMNYSQLQIIPLHIVPK